MVGSMTATQKIKGTTPKPVDRRGNEASIQEGTMTYESTDPGVITVIKDEENEFGFTAIATGKPGAAQVIARADADLGEGVKTIEGVIATFEVRAGQATGFGEATLEEPTEYEEATGFDGPAELEQPTEA